MRSGQRTCKARRRLLAFALCLAGVGASVPAAGAAPAQEGCGAPAGACLQLADLALQSDGMPIAPGAVGHAGDGGPVQKAAPPPGQDTGGTLDFMFRTFADAQTVENVVERHAWTQNMQAHYASAFTSGAVGWGVDLSPFATLVLAASRDAGNMVSVRPDGVTQDRRLRVHLGRYALKARVGDMLLKYGLQQFSNPFLESKDNRGMPSAFKGVSLSGRPLPGLLVEAGKVTAVMGRNQAELTPLSTTYGATRYDWLGYAGASWDYAENGNLALYASQASDVWNQVFFSLRDGAGNLERLKWGANLNVYHSRAQGRQLQGPIDNTAYSAGLSVARHALTVALLYQQILGDQYFDYPNETWGIYLDNAMNVDYNAPHERSLQLRGTIDGARLAYPGFRLMLWAMAGWGADGTAQSGHHAAPDSPLYYLYWKNGQPMRGSHREIGFNPVFTVQGGRFKDTRISLIATWHRSSRYYVDDANREFKLTVDVPWKGF